MKTSKITVIGLLFCLTSIFFTNEIWVGIAVLETLPVLGLFGFPIGLIVTLVGLFMNEENINNESNNTVGDENRIRVCSH